MIPPERVSDPVSLSGGPIAVSSKGSLEGRSADRRASSGARHHDARHEPRPGQRDGLGARVAQLVDEIFHAGTVDGAADGDDDPGTRCRIDARVEPHAAQVGAQLIDGGVTTLRVLDKGREVALERGDLASQLVVAVIEVRDEDGEVLR